MKFTSNAKIIGRVSNLWISSVKKRIEPDPNQKSASLCLNLLLE